MPGLAWRLVVLLSLEHRASWEARHSPLGDIWNFSEVCCRGAAGSCRGCVRGRLLEALECPLGPLSRTESSANWLGRSGSDWATPPLACLQGIGSLWSSHTSKPGWLAFDVQRPRKAGGRRSFGPVCDLQSCSHGPGEDCDRSSSGTLGSCAFLRPGFTGSRWARSQALWGMPWPHSVCEVTQHGSPSSLWSRLSAAGSLLPAETSGGSEVGRAPTWAGAGPHLLQEPPQLALDCGHSPGQYTKA